MDCRTARMLLDFARPRCPELPQGETDALEAHLSGCADLDHFHVASLLIAVRPGTVSFSFSSNRTDKLNQNPAGLA